MPNCDSGPPPGAKKKAHWRIASGKWTGYATWLVFYLFWEGNGNGVGSVV